MLSRADLPNKLAAATVSVTFDFLSQLAQGETLSAAAVTCAVYSGTDANPSALVSGVATISGSQVTQKIAGGLLGVLYELTCSVTTSAGQTLKQTGLMGIVQGAP